MNSHARTEELWNFSRFSFRDFDVNVLKAIYPFKDTSIWSNSYTEGFPPVLWISECTNSGFLVLCIQEYRGVTLKSHYSLRVCRKTDLNLRLVAATTNGFIFQILASLTRSSGYAWPVLTVIEDAISSSKYGIDKIPRYNCPRASRAKTVDLRGGQLNATQGFAGGIKILDRAVKSKM